MSKRNKNDLLGNATQTMQQRDAQEKLVKALTSICRLIGEKHNYEPAECMLEAAAAGNGIMRVLNKGMLEIIRLHNRNIEE